MAFRFRLEKVLSHRRRLVDLRSRDVAAAAYRVAGIERSITDRRADQAHTAARGATALRVEEKRRCAAWITHLEELIARLEADRRTAAAALDEARAALHAAWRDREVLEQLRRRRLAEWQAETARRERADLDEIGQQRAAARQRQQRAVRAAENAGSPGTPRQSGAA
jgi:flagellar export protein FliJ